MGQINCTPAKEVNEVIEDIIWNEKEPISFSVIKSKLTGVLITSEVVHDVVKNLQTKEEEHYKKSLFFLRKSCMSLSDHHNNLRHRYHTAKFILIHNFIDPKM